MNARLVALVVTTTLALPAAVGSPVLSAASAAPAAVVEPVLVSITPDVNGWRPSVVTAVFRGVEPGPVECRVDASAWAPCVDGTITTPALGQGAHTLGARMAYADVPVGPERVVTFNVDVTAPSVTLPSAAKVAKFTKSRAVTATWTGKDADSGVASYQVGVKRLSPGTTKASWTYPTELSAVKRTSASISATRGQTVCWIVRATDNAGVAGAWSSQRCTATLLDDRAVGHSTGWSKKKATKAYLGTFSQTKKDRAYFTLPRTTASEVSFVFTTCPTCGSVDFRINGKLIDIIDTYSPKTRYGVVKTFKTKSKGRPIRITAVANTFGFVPVKIDGFGLYRS